VSCREFTKAAAGGPGAASVLAAGIPSIVPASVFGRNAPGTRINIGAIGTGLISRGHDMPGAELEGARS
jgi:hypothetical protein